jgi:thiosulfate/3-mercaptopyruvate sulfurtransferase
MRAAGVSRNRPVVVYDDGDAMSAARGWWTLRYFGHPDVRVLDGGYRAWAWAGLPVTTAEPAPVSGDFTAAPGQMPAAAYCGSGVTAAHEVLALALAGIPAALYVGSWSNWVTDPARPVATGGGGPGDATG